MRADSIISNTISEEIRQKGHQTIRFTPDGFSLLVSDASYRPVLLKRFTYESSVPSGQHPVDCARVLQEEKLLGFEGENVLIADTICFTLVPRPLFDEKQERELLEKACALSEGDHILRRMIRNGSVYLLFAVPESLVQLQNKFKGEAKIIHISECLISLADQVQASDHQRGAILVDIQPSTLDILVVQEDQIRLLNRYPLNDLSEFIYHTLNTVKQLGLDRETIPVYLSGVVQEEHELYGLLGKYIRTIRTTPYYMEEVSKAEMLRSMILSEGSKCA